MTQHNVGMGDGSAADLWSTTLSDVVAGHASSAELVGLVIDDAGAQRVADALADGLSIQDWDAVEALLPVCCAYPSERYVSPLSAILDRQCLEISNLLVVEALERTGSASAAPALRRAVERTSTPHADWVPDAAGLQQAQDLCTRGEEALRAIDRARSIPTRLEPSATDTRSTG